MPVNLSGHQPPRHPLNCQCSDNGIKASLQAASTDQVNFSGTATANPKRSAGFWPRLRQFLLTPFLWLHAIWRDRNLKQLRPKDKAPDFSLKDHAGQPVQLYEALKKGPVVLFFYPKNNTAFCTKQIKAFRDSYPAFRQRGASVFGISSDSEKSHQQVNTDQRLPFALLSDPGGAIRRQYGAQRLGGLIPNRTTFIIDPATQSVRSVYSSQANIQKHIDIALQALRPNPLSLTL